jgi:hypothetical protein
MINYYHKKENEMVIIDNQKHITKIFHHTCEYHKQHPMDHNYAGCTCSSSYSLKTENANFRSLDRIDRILKLISIIWHKAPDLRLGQLLYNFANFRDDIFSIEDNDTEDKLMTAFIHYYNDGEDL